jgi:predicted KAP-like P-loop ATPase
MSTSPFHGDRPIDTKAQDRFGFNALAVRIADALTAQAAGKGFVMGVEGRWGTGKSSLLALIVTCLREMDHRKVAVVEFRPWLIGDRDQLLTGLFEDIVKAISSLEYAGSDSTPTHLSAKEVAEKARRFASHLGPVGKLAGLVGAFVPGASALGTIVESIATAAKEASVGPTLAQQKDDLSSSLLKLDCRIVVAIDDVDRLEPNEVAELLRLVRSVADFPNISYLLCYDAATLGHAIEQATKVENGSAYLQKIVQTPISVPQPESFALRTWFKAELESFAECEEERVPDLLQMIDDTGGRSFDTARSVVRALDSVRA